MRLIQRSFLTIVLFITLFLSGSPQTSQAQSTVLSPGIYAGRFQFTSKDLLDDWAQEDDVEVKTEYHSSVQIKGKLSFQIDTDGQTISNVSIQLSPTVADYHHTLFINKMACDVVIDLYAKASGTLKPVTSGSAGNIIMADINLSNVSPVLFNIAGISKDCKTLGNENSAEEGMNKHISSLNQRKSMQFVITRASEMAISGFIQIPGLNYLQQTPHGRIQLSGTGYFNVKKIGPPIDPSEGTSTYPLGEWRGK
ncbi:MAG: hypothetical protein C3F13_11160 [Anaerolineales bacterium]|nr:hypothetical protein [Anaerolineae bacterium]PWB52692.1 MAG: hypothetical protein C3F13_11160 [Anaerolineales bacterium]